MGKGKVYLLTLAGLSIAFAGLYVIFGYITSIVDGANIWLLLAGIPLIGAGAFLLYRAGNSVATVVKKNIYKPMDLEGGFSPEKKGMVKTVEKNKALTAEFAKTNDNRNRLKLLEAAANVEK
jgi:hypothetical protein